MRDVRRHIPVLEQTVYDMLKPSSGERVLDCTLGLGGHARGFLERIGKQGMLIGLDADTQNLTDAQKNLAEFEGRTRLIHTNFGDVGQLALAPVDVVFADLGLSSPHLDEEGRGFGFKTDGPLDLRFDQARGESAAAMLRHADEHTLVYVFRTYGELKDVRRLIAGIRNGPPETTRQLRAIVEEAFGWKASAVMAQVFQALRIWVNDELGTLQSLLDALPRLLTKSGRCGIISYHSLEDRLVKRSFKALVTPVKDPVTGKPQGQPPWALVAPKGIVPTAEEIAANPRARSARLRIIRRLP